MKWYCFNRITSTLFVAFACAVATGCGEDAPPAPDTASDVGRAMWAQRAKPPTTPIRWPGHDDHDAWAATQRYVARLALPIAAAAVERLGLTVEEEVVGEVDVIKLLPRGYEARDGARGRVVVYLHGGGYVLHSAKSTLQACAPIAHAAGVPVYSVDYTLAPHARFEEVTGEAVAVVRGLVEMGYALGSVAVVGDSAGAGLAAAVVLRLRDEGDGLVGAVVLRSGWLDLGMSGDTYRTLAGVDPAFPEASFLETAAEAYAGGNLEHPWVSPIYGDFTGGFPATLIQVGGREPTLSDSLRFYAAVDRAAAHAQLQVFEGMWHGFAASPQKSLPEANHALASTVDFLQKHLH